MVRPPVTDYRAIIDELRRHGSVHYPRSAVPGEFTVWRRRLRQVARADEVRISVTRGLDYVLIENPTSMVWGSVSCDGEGWGIP
ncbi:MAG: hypothetical protein M3N95_16970 [Actinomycetota bacterium]|nr:hypothetical protein [Actinomycetota bacterium]